MHIQDTSQAQKTLHAFDAWLAEQKINERLFAGMTDRDKVEFGFRLAVGAIVRLAITDDGARCMYDAEATAKARLHVTAPVRRVLWDRLPNGEQDLAREQSAAYVQALTKLLGATPILITEQEGV